MIHITYARHGGEHRLNITGHAGYAPPGQDIVCAAVSALTESLWAWLLQRRVIPEEIREGICFRIPRDTECEAAFSVIFTGLLGIVRAYPQYVRFAITSSVEETGKEQYHAGNHHIHSGG